MADAKDATASPRVLLDEGLKRLTHKLNVLTGWLIAVTVILVGFGIFDIVMRLHGCG